MITSTIKERIDSDIHTVWQTLLNVNLYPTWRSDISRMEITDTKQFIEYTNDGYPTRFTVTVIDPYKRWEFDMENNNMKGHWTGIFTPDGHKTHIEFTESVTVKNIIMKPFVKAFLKKQQIQFINDLKKILEQ